MADRLVFITIAGTGVTSGILNRMKQNMNLQDAVIRTLEDAGKPLHVKEITKRIIAAGLWSSSGKTPDATVGSHLYSDIRKHGERSSFVKISPQMFSLRNTEPPSVNDLDNSSSRVEADSTDSNIFYTFLDAAEKVLDDFGNRNPMHYGDITKISLEKGWLKTSGKTPEATMNSLLLSESKRAETSDVPGRFSRTSRGYYALVKWRNSDLQLEIQEHKRKIKKKLLFQLMKLPETQFENFIAKELLPEMGFENVWRTPQSSDGGIDVRGTLLVGIAVRIKMAVQAKRWKNNIGAPIVRDVRGSLSIHEQGLIITTSDFSPQAKKEANQPDKTPVALMNGEQLVEQLMSLMDGEKLAEQLKGYEDG